jgi:hypothetical protein
MERSDAVLALPLCLKQQTPKQSAGYKETPGLELHGVWSWITLTLIADDHFTSRHSPGFVAYTIA